MSRAIPWSIKGVDPDAREAATDAAHREGLTLGQWLKQTIEAYAAQKGLDAFYLDDQARAAAVKERLARIDHDTPARPSSLEHSQWRASRPYTPQPQNRVDEMLRDLARRLEARDRTVAQDAVDRKTSAESARPSRPHAREDRNPPQGQQTGAPLQIDRKTELEEALRAARALYGARRAGKPLRQEAPEPQEAHDEAYHQETSQDAYPFTRPAPLSPVKSETKAQEAPISRIGQRPDRTPRLEDVSLRKELDQLSGTISALQRGERANRRGQTQRQEHASDQPQRDVARSQEIRAQVEAAPGKRHGLADPLSNVSLITIERHLQSLSSKVEALRETVTNRSALDAFQTRAKGIQDQIEEIAGRPDNAAKIERQLDLLGSRIDALTTSTPTLSDAQELAQGLTEIRTILSKAPNQTLLEALDRKIELLARKLEHALTTADHAPQFDDLARRIDNVHRRVESNESLLAKVDTSALEKMMQDLANKLAQPAPKIETPPAPNLAPVESEIRRLANKMDAVASRPENPVLEGLRRDIASLSARVDTVSATAQSAATMANQASAETLEALRKEMAGFSARLDALTSSAPEVSVLDGLQAQIALLVDRVEVLTRREPPGVHALESRIVQLAGKMDALGAPSREGAMLVQLQAEIGRLGRQIDASPGEVRAPVIALLEQVQSYLAKMPQQTVLAGASVQEAAVASSMSDLFRQIQDLRNATADSADLAARASAQEALEAKAQTHAPNPDAEEAVKRELEDLRAKQERADRRTTETLSAVHQTMERLVGRLSSLESEIGEVRPEPVSPAQTGAGNAQREPVAEVQQRPSQDNKKEPAQEEPPEVRAEPRQAPVSEAATPTPQVEKPAEQPSAQTRAPSAGAALLNRASFIAAARRATNASNETEQDKAVSRLENLINQMSGRSAEAASEATLQTQPQAQPEQAKGPLGALRKAISARRKPMLIALAGLIVVLASLQALRSRDGGAPAATLADNERPAVTQTATVAKPAETAAAPAPVSTPEPAQTLASPGSIAAAPEAAAGQGFTPPLQANGFDQSPVGSTPSPTQRLAEAATKGNPAAEFEMGVRLAEGRGVSVDNPAALQWFEKAAQQNVAPAQFRLAAMLERSLGADKDLKRAADVYARAANQGHVRAMHNLGVLHAEGLDGKPDYVTAANWFRKASEYGVGDSQYNLAILYARGMGVDKNLPMAWAWFSAAATQGDKDSAQKRDDITLRLNGAQMTAAKAIAEAFRPRTPDPAINQVTTPPGGWETLSVASPPKPAATTTPPKAKVSKL